MDPLDLCLLTKVRFDDTFFFELGLSDGENGIVGGMGNVQAFAAEEFFRLFFRPRIVDRRLDPRPADEGAGADVAALLVGSLEKGTEHSIDVGRVGLGTLLTVLRACGASESAGHVWYKPEPLLTLGSKRHVPPTRLQEMRTVLRGRCSGYH